MDTTLSIQILSTLSAELRKRLGLSVEDAVALVMTSGVAERIHRGAVETTQVDTLYQELIAEINL